VRFRTAQAGAFTQGPLGSTTDRRLSLDEAPDLSRASDEAARLEMAADYVARRLKPQAPDDRVAVAVAAIRQSEGRVPLQALCDAAGLTARGLQRRFLDEVGVPARTLASIVRFRRLFEALQQPGVETWTDAAQGAGYFDHPQMTRDFNRFLGTTPRAFLKAQRGLATHIAGG
jgi:methylphosphotriester-DNA--protein-cysteine methyltransferase